MAKRYPVVGPWQRVNTDTYSGMVGAKTDCGHVTLAKHQFFWRRETQISYMRGDDEVETRCTECGPDHAQGKI